MLDLTAPLLGGKRARGRPKYSLDRTAVEENDALQLLVVEEVVERPEAARLAERVRVQVRIVAVDVAVLQRDLVLDRRPEGVADLAVLFARHRAQVALDRVQHPLQRRFLAELMALGNAGEERKNG